MKLYRTERKVYKFELDKKEFLKFLKRIEPNDEDVQKAETFDDLLKIFTLDDFEEELTVFLDTYYSQHIYASHTSYYDNADDAYEDMEYGIH